MPGDEPEQGPGGVPEGAPGRSGGPLVDETVPAAGSLDASSPRRRLLQLLLGGSTLAVGGLLGVPVASYLRPLEADLGQSVAAFGDDELALWEARQVVVRGRPVWVVNTGEGYVAVNAVCTHLGCIVKWRKGRRQFFCPCHGGRFDLEGNVLGGPAPRPLARLTVERIPGTVVVRAG